MNKDEAFDLYWENLDLFLKNSRKKYLFHPKSGAMRVDKACVISHKKYGNPVQINKDGIKVIYAGSQNSAGTEIKLTAIRFIAECVLGKILFFDKVGVEPSDHDYSKISFQNVSFVDTNESYKHEHQGIDFSELDSVGALWFNNNFQKVV